MKREKDPFSRHWEFLSSVSKELKVGNKKKSLKRKFRLFALFQMNFFLSRKMRKIIRCVEMNHFLHRIVLTPPDGKVTKAYRVNCNQWQKSKNLLLPFHRMALRQSDAKRDSFQCNAQFFPCCTEKFVQQNLDLVTAIGSRKSVTKSKVKYRGLLSKVVSRPNVTKLKFVTKSKFYCIHS